MKEYAQIFKEVQTSTFLIIYFFQYPSQAFLVSKKYIQGLQGQGYTDLSGSTNKKLFCVSFLTEALTQN